MTFEHVYTFTNEGPSYTIKENLVMLHIPIRPDILIEISDSGISCKDAGESQSVQIDGVVPAEVYNSVNCSDSKCRNYECLWERPRKVVWYPLAIESRSMNAKRCFIR